MLKSCRTCLLKLEDEQSLTSLSETIETGTKCIKIIQMIALCTGLEIASNDEYSYEICNNCISDVKNAYLFRQKCWLSEMTLKTTGQNKMENLMLKENLKKDRSLSISPFETWDNDCHQNFDCDVEIDNVNESKIDPIGETEEVEEIIKTRRKRAKKVSKVEKSLVDEVDRKKIEIDEDTEEKPKKKRMRKKQKKRPYKPEQKICEVCGQILASPQILHTHMKAVHHNERPFACSICDYRSHRKAGLGEHMRKHTGEKPYECDICHKFYQSASARASHRRIHFDERPYVCDVCGKAFKKVDYLIGHKKTHDPASRRQCQYCDKTFIKLEHLRNHEMFHRNEKAYTCAVCGKGFIQKKYYTSHIKICGQTTESQSTVAQPENNSTL